MAKAAWLTVEPQSGQGNATVQNTGTVHTGRTQRTTTVTGVASGVEAAKSYQVVQEPTPVFNNVQTRTFNVAKGAVTITLNGTSNAASIGMSAVAGSSITFSFPDTIKVNNIDVELGSPIPNDPGAVAQYTWSAVVNIPANTVGERTGKFNVTAEGCDPIEISVTQATSTYSVTYSKGSYINTISKTSETVNYGGTATCTATLPSNTAQYTYAFDGWYEGNSKISSNLALSVSNITKNRTFTATGTRTLNRYTMTITVTPTGGGTVSGGGTYDYGSSVTLTATPATGYNFVKFVDEEGAEHTANPSSGWQITKNRTVQAVFALKQYNISLAAQYRVAESGDYTSGTTGGTVSGGGTKTHGTAVSASAAPATGYDFVGWYSGTSLQSSANPYEFTVTGDRSLTARFQRKWFTITFTAGTGGSVAPTSQRVQYGGTATSKATPNTGYTFIKWSNDSTNATITVSNVTAAATYTATFTINKYTITYAKTTGIASVSRASETVNYGSNAQGSTATLTTGYDFSGWYNSDNTRVSTSLTYAPTNVTTSATYTAKATIKTFQITATAQYRDADNTGSFTTGTTGGTVTGGGTYDYGEKVTLTAAAKTGYSFSGWYDSEGSQVSTSASYVINSVTAAVTLYARFQKLWYTVTFAKGTGVNDLSSSSTRVAYNGTVNSPTATAATGYNSPTWILTSGTASISVASGVATLTGVTSNVTITASATINSYTITYTKGTGVASVSRDSETVIHGSNAAGSTATVSTGYDFSGWYSGSSRVSSSTTFAPTNVTASATYEARAVIKTFTVTVNAYYRNTDGTGNYTSGTTGGTVSGGGTVNYGSDKTVIASAATGYTFDGWYSDGASGGTLLSSSASYSITNVTANQTVYARFTKKYYTITYEKGDYINTISRASERVAHGGTAVGCTATPNTTTVQYSYSFSGWYNASGSSVSTTATYAPTNVTANVTYTAKATRVLRSYKISVSLDPSNRGSVSGGGTYSYGDSVTVTCTKTNSSDAFGGWYEGGTRVSTSLSYNFTCTGARTLQAKIYYLTISPTSLSFTNASSSKTFTITSNVDWELS